VNKATFHSLTAAEQTLILDTEAPRLLEFDEEQLIALHDRVRKQRAKAVSQYRRGASARVDAKGARGKQRLGGPPRDALKAEVWEDALGRVSARLAKLAKQSAKALRDERIAAARNQRATPSTPAATKQAAATSPAAGRARRRTPAETKRQSSMQAAGKRRQAARDAK
jgi:hypothetical protein